MIREIKIFLNRNKIQLFIAAICIWITIKQSGAPCLFSYNKFTSFLFERVTGNTIWASALSFLNNLGFAYYSSLIFYYVVDYFPTRKKEKIALKIVSEHLSQLAICIEQLFVSLLFFSNNGNKLEDLRKNKALSELCKLRLTNDEVCCSWEIKYSKTANTYHRISSTVLYPFDYIKSTCQAILNEVDNIYSHANAEMLEPEIKELLLILKENRYIKNARSLDGSILNDNPISIIDACGKRDLLEILGVRLMLKRLPIEQFSFTMENVDEQEIREIKESYEKLRTSNPDSIALYEKILESRTKS